MFNHLLVATVFLGVAAPLSAQSPELAMVPEDAAVFMHMRVADVWKHDALKSIRDTVAAAGPKAFAAWEQQVYPNPGELDTITIFSIIRDKEFKDMPGGAVVLKFKSDVDPEKIRKLYLPAAKEKKIGDKKLW